MNDAKRRDEKLTIAPDAALALQGRVTPAREGVRRVVVLGGGFAGIHTAKYLTDLLGSRKDVEVELLSDENYFVFQPLLPEVAAGGISPASDDPDPPYSPWLGRFRAGSD